MKRPRETPLSNFFIFPQWRGWHINLFLSMFSFPFEKLLQLTWMFFIMNKTVHTCEFNKTQRERFMEEFFLVCKQNFCTFFSFCAVFAARKLNGWDRVKYWSHCLQLIYQNLNMLHIINCYRSIILPFIAVSFSSHSIHTKTRRSHNMNYLSVGETCFKIVSTWRRVLKT